MIFRSLKGYQCSESLQLTLPDPWHMLVFPVLMQCFFNSILKHSRENFNGEKNCFHKRKIWTEQHHPQEKQLPLSPEIMWQLLLARANTHHSQGRRAQNCCYLSVTEAKHRDLQKHQPSRTIDSPLSSWWYNLQWDQTDFLLMTTQSVVPEISQPIYTFVVLEIIKQVTNF